MLGPNLNLLTLPFREGVGYQADGWVNSEDETNSSYKCVSTNFVLWPIIEEVMKAFTQG